MFRPCFLLMWIAVVIFSCGNNLSSEGNKKEKITAEHLDSVKNKICSLYDSMPPVQSGDWLDVHPEKFVSFADYCQSSPVRPDEIRNVIYLQPFDDLDSNGKKIVGIVGDYLRAFYGLKVIVNHPLSINDVPENERRYRNHDIQIKTSWFLEKQLLPALPKDAAVMIGLTGKDLYPDDDWNYVFGQAYLKERVGVWSINRLCDLESQEKKDWMLCLVRTLNTAAHETGHMFSISHCIKFSCVMNGSNSLEESDRKPSRLCPDCLCKLSWNLQREPKEHFADLKKFWEKYDRPDYVDFYLKNLEALHQLTASRK